MPEPTVKSLQPGELFIIGGKSAVPQMAMFTHLVDGDWEEKTLQECLHMVATGAFEEITAGVTAYDDGLRSFQCANPCGRCDSHIEALA